MKESLNTKEIVVPVSYPHSVKTDKNENIFVPNAGLSPEQILNKNPGKI
jgi:hypothetical protein